MTIVVNAHHAFWSVMECTELLCKNNILRYFLGISTLMCTFWNPVLNAQHQVIMKWKHTLGTTPQQSALLQTVSYYKIITAFYFKCMYLQNKSSTNVKLKHALSLYMYYTCAVLYFFSHTLPSFSGSCPQYKQNTIILTLGYIPISWPPLIPNSKGWRVLLNILYMSGVRNVYSSKDLKSFNINP